VTLDGAEIMRLKDGARRILHPLQSAFVEHDAGFSALLHTWPDLSAQALINEGHRRLAMMFAN